MLFKPYGTLKICQCSLSTHATGRDGLYQMDATNALGQGGPNYTIKHHNVAADFSFKPGRSTPVLTWNMSALYYFDLQTHEPLWNVCFMSSSFIFLLLFKTAFKPFCSLWKTVMSTKVADAPAEVCVSSRLRPYGDSGIGPRAVSHCKQTDWTRVSRKLKGFILNIDAALLRSLCLCLCSVLSRGYCKAADLSVTSQTSDIILLLKLQQSQIWRLNSTSGSPTGICRSPVIWDYWCMFFFFLRC